MWGLINIILVAIIVTLGYKYFELNSSLSPNEKRDSRLIDAVASIVDQVEGYNKPHAKDVAEIAIKIAKKTSMERSQLISLEKAAKLHDVGMILVMNDFMKSRQKLKGENVFLLKNHTLLAEVYLRQELSITDEIPSIIRWHHERWDGFGYPDSLKGEQIPLPSRVLAIADAISSMKNSRNYRKKNYKSTQEIIEELKKQSSLQFDPNLVNIAVSILEKDE